MSSDTDPKIEIKVVFIGGEPHVKWPDAQRAFDLIDDTPEAGEELETWVSQETYEVVETAVREAKSAAEAVLTLGLGPVCCTELPIKVHIQRLREIGGD